MELKLKLEPKPELEPVQSDGSGSGSKPNTPALGGSGSETLIKRLHAAQNPSRANPNPYKCWEIMHFR